MDNLEVLSVDHLIGNFVEQETVGGLPVDAVDRLLLGGEGHLDRLLQTDMAVRGSAFGQGVGDRLAGLLVVERKLHKGQFAVFTGFAD